MPLFNTHDRCETYLQQNTTASFEYFLNHWKSVYIFAAKASKVYKMNLGNVRDIDQQTINKAVAFIQDPK